MIRQPNSPFLAGIWAEMEHPSEKYHETFNGQSESKPLFNVLFYSSASPITALGFYLVHGERSPPTGPPMPLQATM